MTLDNIKPPLVTTNEKVVAYVEEHLAENHTDLSRHDLAEFLYGWYIVRTKQHVSYVRQAGAKLRPAFEEYGFGDRFESFLRNLEMHDNDKFENSALYIALNILGSAAYDKELNKRFKASQYAKVMYDTKVWPEHAESNAHHPESWAHIPRNMTGRPLICSDYALFGEEYEPGSDYPADVRYHGFEKLAETVADWAGMGIELNDTAIDWYHKTKGVKWEFSGLAEQYLTTLLSVSKEVYAYTYNNVLKTITLPKYIEPEVPKIEVQSVETCGCYVTEVSAEALETAKESNTFSQTVQSALKKFMKYDYACLYKDGVLIKDQSEMNKRDGTDIIIQTKSQVDANKAGMCHDMTCYFDELLSREKTDHYTLYIASNEPPHFTTHSFTVVKNNRGKWSVIDVFAVKPGYYKTEFNTAEEAAISRIKLWIKLDNHNSDNAEAFMTKTCPSAGVDMKSWMESIEKSGHFSKWKDSSIPMLSKENLESRIVSVDVSMEDMALLTKTTEQKKLNSLAKPLYNLKGQNSWEHIQQDVGNAIFLVKEGFNRELTNQEYATILFHDCSVKTHPDKVKHSLTSANIAKPILLKCGLFTEQEVDDICQAIIEHDIDMNPEMKFSTFLSDLLASADFNPPNPAWILNKSWSWGIKHGLDYEARLNNTMSKIPGFYGSKGGAVYPKLYKEIHGDEIHEMQQFFDQLTREKCEKIIKDYRKKHHLNDTDTTLPDPSMEALSFDVQNVNMRELTEEPTEEEYEIILKSSNEAAKASSDPLWTMDELKKARKSKGSKYRHLCIFYAGSQPIGSAMYMDPDPKVRCFSIGDFGLHKEYQGKGLGSKCFRLIMNKLKRKDPSLPIYLGVAANNERAIKLYEKFGFKIVKTGTEGKKKFYQMCYGTPLKVSEESLSDKISFNIREDKVYHCSPLKYEVLKDTKTYSSKEGLKNSSSEKKLILKKCTGTDEEVKLLTIGQNDAMKASHHKERLSEDDLRNWMKRKDSSYFLVYEGSTPVGMTMVDKESKNSEQNNFTTVKTDYIEISEVAIFKEYRGKGYGFALMKSVVEYIKKTYPGYPCIVRCVPDNKAAIGLYKKSGFVVDKEYSNGKDDDGKEILGMTLILKDSSSEVIHSW